jgi:hypothetical protein
MRQRSQQVRADGVGARPRAHQEPPPPGTPPQRPPPVAPPAQPPITDPLPPGEHIPVTEPPARPMQAAASVSIAA